MNVRRYGLTLVALIGISVFSGLLVAQDDVHTVVFDNLSFSFPASLATGLQIETKEANPLLQPDEQFWVATYPEHIRFSFMNYLDGNRFRLPLLQDAYPDTAQIFVYTTESLREFGYEFLEQHTALDTLLRARLDLSAYVGATVRLPEVRLPFLPWVNSHQVLRSHPQHIELDGGGSGVRYLTYYSQEAGHLTDQQLFYTFQGLLAEDAVYVSAVFPVKSAVLPEEVDTSGLDWNEFAAHYNAYLTETFAQIDSLPDEAFNPGLNTLDQLVASISME